MIPSNIEKQFVWPNIRCIKEKEISTYDNHNQTSRALCLRLQLRIMMISYYRSYENEIGWCFQVSIRISAFFVTGTPLNLLLDSLDFELWRPKIYMQACMLSQKGGLENVKCSCEKDLTASVDDLFLVIWWVWCLIKDACWKMLNLILEAKELSKHIRGMGNWLYCQWNQGNFLDHFYGLKSFLPWFSNHVFLFLSTISCLPLALRINAFCYWEMRSEFFLVSMPPDSSSYAVTFGLGWLWVQYQLWNQLASWEDYFFNCRLHSRKVGQWFIDKLMILTCMFQCNGNKLMLFMRRK